MGKSTISTGPFSIANCWHNQRVTLVMVTRGWVMVTRVKQSKWSSHRTSVNQWEFLSGSTHMHIVYIDWKIRYAFLFSGIHKNIQWSLRWHIHTTRDVLPFCIRAAVDHWCWSWALNLKWQVPRPAPCGAAQISRFRLGGLGMLPMVFFTTHQWI